MLNTLLLGCGARLVGIDILVKVRCAFHSSMVLVAYLPVPPKCPLLTGSGSASRFPVPPKCPLLTGPGRASRATGRTGSTGVAIGSAAAQASVVRRRWIGRMADDAV